MSGGRNRRLLPFDRCGRLATDVVADAVDAFDLVDDSRAHPGEQVVRQAAPVGRHEVVRVDAANRDRVVIRSCVSHHADTLHGQQHGKCLAGFAVQSSFLNFFDDNGVGFAKHHAVVRV